MTASTLLDPKLVEQIEEIPRRSDMAYLAIRDAIASGRIKPGEWLRQEALAEELNVSQVTVREALSKLVAEGLAVHVPYKGVKAVLLPIDELEDVYETRALLEGLALKLAADRLSDEQLARMRELLPMTVTDASASSALRAWEANREFHMIAVEASGRRHLARILGQMMDLTNPYAPLSEASERERLQSAIGELKDHTRIVEALEAKDGDLARNLIEEHLKKALETLKACLSGECP
jgi:DNA-binding GntR family transcriptional regulator